MTVVERVGSLALNLEGRQQRTVTNNKLCCADSVLKFDLVLRTCANTCEITKLLELQLIQKIAL
jgi:hypothetical protein